MTDLIHLEEYLYLPALTHDAAIIAWGGFYFKVKDGLDNGRWKLLKENQVPEFDPRRPGTIGISAKPYGIEAKVFVWEEGETEGAPQIIVNQNYAHVRGLKADASYRYRVVVKDSTGREREWGAGPLRDWDFKKGAKNGAMQLATPPRSYKNRFRTFPDPNVEVEELKFAVLGDFGRGICKRSKSDECQREIARALEFAVEDEGIRLILTTGDNIYRGGDDDQDWFYTYFQPYRYLINQTPVFPSFGNHDDGETEARDDRAQVYDNLYALPHFTQLRPHQDASIDPGLFYRVRFGSKIEFICLDTSKDAWLSKRYFDKEQHQMFLDRAFASPSPTWRIPFFHHPPFCAGPDHDGEKEVRRLMAERCKPGGVRVAFSGHQHNFQHAQHDGIDYFITGGGGKFAVDPPNSSRFDDEMTLSWGGNKEGHFLIVEIADDRLSVKPYGKLRPPDSLQMIAVNPVPGRLESLPIVIER